MLANRRHLETALYYGSSFPGHGHTRIPCAFDFEMGSVQYWSVQVEGIQGLTLEGVMAYGLVGMNMQNAILTLLTS